MEKYDFPQTMNQQTRILGLPVDEFLIVAPLVGAGIWLSRTGSFCTLAVILWFLIRHLKRGQGSYWLLNAAYWYLPTCVFMGFLKCTPDSWKRRWMH